MHQIAPLTGLKRHVCTPRSDVFPILGAHMSGVEFQYPDLNWKEPAELMANLVAESGGNKGQLSNIVETLCRDFDFLYFAKINLDEEVQYEGNPANCR